MNQRILGRTGLAMSEISFGGVEIGVPYGIGVTSAADMPTDVQSIKILNEALEQGINFLTRPEFMGAVKRLSAKPSPENANTPSSVQNVIICLKSMADYRKPRNSVRLLKSLFKIAWPLCGRITLTCSCCTMLNWRI